MKQFNFSLIEIKILVVLIFLLPTSLVGENTETEFRKRANKIQTQGYTASDIRAEIKFGRNLAARILTKFPLLENEKASQYVTILGTGLAAQMGRPELEFHFAILDSAELNAFAIPGGYIFITKGLLSIMENEAQLVGVLAHEIAHINQRHIVQNLDIKGEDNSFLSSVGAAVGGGMVSGIVVLDKLVEQAFDLLMGNGMEQNMEFASDQECIQIMIATEYDWQSYYQLLEKISTLTKEKESQTLFRTHPPFKERILRIKQEIQLNDLQTFEGKKNSKRFHENIQL